MAIREIKFLLSPQIRCNHLFVLDNGKVGLAQVCNPKLLIFNLENDTLVKTIHMPLDLATDQTGHGLLIDPFAYMPKGCTPSFLDEMIVSIAFLLKYYLITHLVMYLIFCDLNDSIHI